MNEEFVVQSNAADFESFKKRATWTDIARLMDYRVVVALNEFRAVDPTDAVSIARLQERIRCYLELKEAPDYLVDLLNTNEVKENNDG